MLFPVSGQHACVNYLAELLIQLFCPQLISIVRSAAHNEESDTAEERAHTSGDISLADDLRQKPFSLSQS